MKTFPYKKLCLLSGDIILIIAAFYLGPVLRFGVFLDPLAMFEWADGVAILITLVTFYIFDFYNLDERPSSLGYILRFFVAIAIADILIAALFYIFHIRPYGTTIFAMIALMIFVFGLGWRNLFFRFGRQLGKVSRVLVIGGGEAGTALCRMLACRADFAVVGLLDDDGKKWDRMVENTRVIGSTELIGSFLHRVDMVIVAITHSMNRELYRRLVEAKMKGVAVSMMPAFCEKIFYRIPILHVADPWLISVPIFGVRKNIYNLKIKKVFDKLIALIGIILSFPIAFFTGLAIKLDSKGPVFYRQERVGRDGKTFELIKFRSMRVDAEVNGAVWAKDDDPRVTRIGRIIRLLRFDEIPQFINVIKGEMSLVGPRPERPVFVKNLSEEIPYYSLRHAVPPGITGWAQVNYPYGASKEDALAKLEYDLYYIKNLSPLLDLIILAKTVRTVLFGKGAR